MMQFQVKTAKNPEEGRKAVLPNFLPGRNIKIRQIKNTFDISRRKSHLSPRAKIPDYNRHYMKKNETEVNSTPVESARSRQFNLKKLSMPNYSRILPEIEMKVRLHE